MTLPSISQADLKAFQAAHFSSTPTNYFSHQFLGPVEDDYREEIDNGLGYYGDGTKRTLTDEQIAIFRHSEIQAIVRQRQYDAEARQSTLTRSPGEEGELEDGELDGGRSSTSKPLDTAVQSKKSLSKKARKTQWAKEKGFFKQHVKPDLRKRTWDKVDAGMGSLDYDDFQEGHIAPERSTQRRKVCYDDD